MIRLIALCVVLIAQPVLAEPLEVLDSGHPIANVLLNGQGPYRFVIDTAASGSAVTPKLAKERADLFASGDNRQLAGASGQVGISTVKVRSLGADGKIFQDLVLAALPPSPVDKLGVDGIIGADVLSGSVFDLDIAGGRWELMAAISAEQAALLPPAIPFTLSLGQAPVIPITIEGQRILAIVDTGAKGTIMNAAAARALGLESAGGSLEKGQLIGGATGSAQSLKATLKNVMIGESTRTELPVRIADLPVFQVSGFKLDEPVVLLGIDAFAGGRLVVDYPGKRLFVNFPTP